MHISETVISARGCVVSDILLEKSCYLLWANSYAILGVNRYEKTGVCLIGAETVKVNVIAPHFGEEVS